MMNLFNTETVAQGYGADRPHLHPEVIRKIEKRLGLTGKVKNALDVGCGTGLSTIALKGIAERIIGVDASEAMIASAINESGVSYRSIWPYDK